MLIKVILFSLITGLNAEFIANPDSYDILEDQVLNANVFDNDETINDTDMTIFLQDSSSHHSSLLFDNGLFTYTPILDYNDNLSEEEFTDSFTYCIQWIEEDEQFEDCTSVTINISPVNDPPYFTGTWDAQGENSELFDSQQLENLSLNEDFTYTLTFSAQPDIVPDDESTDVTYSIITTDGSELDDFLDINLIDLNNGIVQINSLLNKNVTYSRWINPYINLIG